MRDDVDGDPLRVISFVQHRAEGFGLSGSRGGSDAVKAPHRVVARGEHECSLSRAT